MRSVLNEEMDLIWDEYAKKISELGFKKMMTTPISELQSIFTLNYKDLFYLVKDINLELGKTRDEIRYSELKLRRLMAIWQKNGIWAVDGGISYSKNDPRNQFPMFASQRPDIVPTIKTIAKLKAKCLHQFIVDFNANYQQNLLAKSKTKVIKNLRDLRNVLMAYEDMDETTANSIIKLYGSAVAKKEINDFSSESIYLGK